MGKKKKQYLIDTSVIIDNPAVNLFTLFQNGENDIFITEVVLQELDKHKISMNHEVGVSARTFFRSVKEEEFKKSKKVLETLKNDIVYQTELKFEDYVDPIKLYIINRKESDYVVDKKDPNDLKILELAKDYELKLITNDISFKVIAISEGVKAESLKMNEVLSPEKITFMKEYFVEDSVLSDEKACKEKLKSIYEGEKKWNQIVINETSRSEETGRKRFFLVNGEGLIAAKTESEDFNELAIKPKNLEQKFYAQMLSMPFKILTVTGSTGSGKTLLAVQEGLRRVKDKNSEIDGIIYMRYTVNTNDKHAELGFRAGDENQKLGYYNAPLYSAINFIIEQSEKKNSAANSEAAKKAGINKNAITEEFMKENNIVVTDIAHARGITLANKFVIFDEVQNAPNSILQLIGTRIGQNAPIVLMGDFRQVDHPYLSKNRNALVTLLRLAEKDPMIAAIQLKSTIRSEVAEWFQENIK